LKTLIEIKEQAKKADYTRVSEIIGKSAELIKAVIKGQRTDLHNIQQVFSDYLEARENVAFKHRKEKQAA